MALVAPISVAQVGEELQVYYDLTQLPDIIDQFANSGETAHIVLEPGDYTQAVGNLTVPANVFITALPGAILPDITGNPTNVSNLNQVAQSATDVGSHVLDQTNPHNVTPEQLGNDQAIWNAGSINGADVTSATPIANHVLTFDGTTGKIIYADPDDLVNHWTAADFAAEFSQLTTDDLPEGSANRYFTDERVNDALEASPLLDDIFEQLDSKLGSGYQPSWANVTGKPTTFTPDYHEHPIGEIVGLQDALGGKANQDHQHDKADITDFVENQYVHTTTNETIAGVKTFEDGIIVQGGIQLSGSLTQFAVDELFLNGTRLLMNADAAGTPTENVFIEVNRGNQTAARIQWRESTDPQSPPFWQIGTSTDLKRVLRLGDPISYLTNDAGMLNVGNIGNRIDTDDLREGEENLFHTGERVMLALRNAGIVDQDNGLVLPTYTTDEVTEGSANRYFEEARVWDSLSASGDLVYNQAGEFSVTTYKPADFAADFAGMTTDDLREGSANLYFTQARFDDAFANKTFSDLADEIFQTDNIYSAGNGIALNSSPTENESYNLGRLFIKSDTGDPTTPALEFSWFNIPYFEIYPDGRTIFGEGDPDDTNFFTTFHNGAETRVKISSLAEAELLLNTDNHYWFMNVIEEIGTLTFMYENPSTSTTFSPMFMYHDEVYVNGKLTVMNNDDESVLRIGINEVANAELEPGEVNVFVNEATDQLTFKVMYSDGTIRSGSVALS